MEVENFTNWLGGDEAIWRDKMSAEDFVRGDATGLMIPAHVEAFRVAGTTFLTRAFIDFGAMSVDNKVTNIVDISPCPGGSTGHKFYLTLDYARSEPQLHRTLFLKFSRDFSDERRDKQRTEMASEARFTALSRQPGFPIHVPLGQFADYHAKSGTGMIITERIDFGVHGIEPHRMKTLDHQTMDNPIDYYRTSVTALARLAGAHKGGTLAPNLEATFPWDRMTGSADPILYSDAALQAELDCCFAFARACPQLLPPELCTDDFFKMMQADAFLIKRNEAKIQSYLCGNPNLIALCHWNAHIDNLWFWRDEQQALHCGLLDWGRVGQITLGSALWGGLSAAHHDVWTAHLDDLLALFAEEYAKAGGPIIKVHDLKRHLIVHIAVMGIARVLAFPEIIQFRLPACANSNGPCDPMFLTSDPARNCLSVYSIFLQLWLNQGFRHHIEQVVR